VNEQALPTQLGLLCGGVGHVLGLQTGGGGVGETQLPAAQVWPVAQARPQ
jgi:hypothetical protein